MAQLEDIIIKAQMTAAQSLIETNQRLSDCLESPYLPFSEKQKIWLQIEQNLGKIGKLKKIREYHKGAS